MQVLYVQTAEFGKYDSRHSARPSQPCQAWLMPPTGGPSNKCAPDSADPGGATNPCAVYLGPRGPATTTPMRRSTKCNHSSAQPQAINQSTNRAICLPPTPWLKRLETSHQGQGPQYAKHQERACAMQQYTTHECSSM